MKMNKLAFVAMAVCATFLTTTLYSQESKPALDHSVYDSWKSISALSIPYDGNILIYGISEQEGDNVLTYRDLRTNKEIVIPRASHIAINSEQTYSLIRISPAFKVSRQARIDKVPADKKPQDSLAIVNLRTGEIQKLTNAKNAKYGETLGDYFAFKMVRSPQDEAENVRKAAEKAEKEKAEKEKAEAEKATKAEGAENTEAAKTDTTATKKPAKPSKDTKWKRQLLIFNMAQMKVVDTLDNVESSFFDKKTSRLFYTVEPDAKNKKDTLRALCIYYPKTGKRDTIFTQNRKAYCGSLNLDDSERFATFLACDDTTKSKSDRPNLYIWDKDGCRIFLSKDDERIPEGMGLRTKLGLTYSADSSRFYFRLRPIPPKKDTTSVPSFERAEVAIWTWNEEYLRTQQKSLLLLGEKAKSYLTSVAADGSGDFVVYEDEELRSVSVKSDYKGDYVLASTDKPYRIQQQWDRERLYDVYRVSLKDGSREKIRTALKCQSMIASPDGRWYVWFAPEEGEWYIYDVENNTDRCFTKDLGGIFYDDESDVPTLAGPCGSPRWQSDSKAFYLNDKFDIWKIDPTGAKAPKRLTAGAEANRRYRINTKILSKLGIPSDKSGYIDPAKPVYLNVFDRTTKENGLAVLEKDRFKLLDIGTYTYAAAAVSTKPRSSKRTFAAVRGNFETGNDVYLTSDDFKKTVKISEANPQKKDYNWGTVELIDWTVKDGSKVEGLVYKPEDFDPTKKYPVIVYFYEKYSDDLYAVRSPAPSRSVINIPYFVSNGYVVFVPDIRYEIGHPGESAMDYILSGCDKLCTYPWVNSEKMGIQGQSWGGYQVAYLVTHTDRFAAAGAGAPVSNMTSAYGGIRWGSGVVRQFQYEQGQSRIGKDLWEGYDLYIENSPIFNVPKVTTPVLIMHNDKDTAVPWYQGIEFFTALRRCGKRAWMLQYIGEDHNLMQRRNCKDLSVRLGEFFDHYLKDAPMPDWMENGVQAWNE